MFLLRTIVAILCLLAVPAQAQNYQGECTPDYVEYARKIVFLTTKEVSEKETTWFSGTAAWLTPTTLVTIGHVVERVLRTDEWSEITLRRSPEPDKPYQDYVEYQRQEFDADPGVTSKTQGRLLKVFNQVNGEYIAVVEIDQPIGRPAEMIAVPDPGRMWKSSQPGDPVFGVLFVGGEVWPELRYAGGHVFKQFFQQVSEDGGKLNPEQLFLEMITRPEPRKSRAVSNFGSSGFPIFNCDGVLVGVVTQQATQNTSLGILPTAWGVPNILGVRVSKEVAAELYKMQQE